LAAKSSMGRMATGQDELHQFFSETSPVFFLAFSLMFSSFFISWKIVSQKPLSFDRVKKIELPILSGRQVVYRPLLC